MAQQQMAGFAVIVALLFLVLAVSACSSFEQAAADNPRSGPMAIAAIAPETRATPEFHAARIGDDHLRSRLQSF